MVEAEFDQMAEVYDSTREPATQREVDAMVAAMDGCRTVLDVGVGTGRWAKPLQDRGFAVVGVDISGKMMEKAAEKGVKDLVMADARSLPFRDGSFDASTVVHVLHIVSDWRSMMREVGRVTRKEVLSLLRERGRRRGPGEGGAAGWRDFLRDQDPNSVGALYARLREESGYPVQRPGGFGRPGRMWQNEEEVRTEVPPARVERVRDEVVTMTVADALRMRRGWGGRSAHVPEEVRAQIFERIIRERGGETFQRRVVQDLAVWHPEQLLSIRAGGKP